MVHLRGHAGRGHTPQAHAHVAHHSLTGRPHHAAGVARPKASSLVPLCSSLHCRLQPCPAALNPVAAPRVPVPRSFVVARSADTDTAAQQKQPDDSGNAELEIVKAKIAGLEGELNVVKEKIANLELLPVGNPERQPLAGLEQRRDRLEQRLVGLQEYENLLLKAEQGQGEWTKPLSDNKVYKDITLYLPTMSEDAVTWGKSITLDFATRSEIQKFLSKANEPAVLVPVEAVSSTQEELARLRVSLVERVDLQDGGSYLLIYLSTPLLDWGKTLEGWQSSITGGQENAAGRLAARLLLEHGHKGVKEVYPGKVKVPGMPGYLVEIDGAATARKCAVIVEAKAKLDATSAEQLKTKISTVLRNRQGPDAPEALQPFAGKEIQGVLMGEIVETNQENRKTLLRLITDNKFEVYGPNGKAYSMGVQEFEDR